MASEIRTVIFSQNEVVRAITEFRKHIGRPLPRGSVFKFSIRDKPKLELKLAIAIEGQEKLEDVTVTADELGAAFVMFCISSRIPLPARDATKAIRALGDNLALIVSKNATTQQLSDFLNLD